MVALLVLMLLPRRVVLASYASLPPCDAVESGHFGISLLEDLILSEQWAGQRLLSDKVTRPHIRAKQSHFDSFCDCVRGNRNSTWVSVHQLLQEGPVQAPWRYG